MRLEAAELYLIQLPYVRPFETSGWRETHAQRVLVALHSEGVTGWGEVVAQAAPWYSPETVETAWHVLHDIFLPAVLGQGADSPAQLFAPLAHFRGHPMARAALECAWWDLRGRQTGRSLKEMLGGVRDRVEVGVSLGIEPDLATLLGRIESFAGQGYGRVKIKIKPGWDVEVMRAARDHFPDLRLMADANSAYELEQAPILAQLDGLELLMIEQPFDHDDFLDHALAQESLQTPICLDESIRHARDARLALEIGACRVINIKPGRVGGTSEAIAIHDLCRDRGVPVWCGGMLETGIGRAHNVALAALPNFTLPGDISATDRYFLEDIAHPPFVLHAQDSTLSVPSGPGLGVDVVPHRLAKATLRHTRL